METFEARRIASPTVVTQRNWDTNLQLQLENFGVLGVGVFGDFGLSRVG